ncbi:uncharacterized protein B0H18DRAFT_1113812 [Fomitopsis serialis]|uniref:uncharacterized protein n=1 Tax=Fomitopsis serialis TaxID=139415 RepID=UPI002008B176|nr:uncharacterized protein B0H18DRAFT_1113812 [Neoantrodia serialis]KAH9936424.1 hypothetical protein B0H18DRAFT_1113812 [Neoantrodia serialis]
MDATQGTHNDPESTDNAGEPNDSRAAATNQGRFRVDFNLVNAFTDTLMGMRPFLGRAAPAPVPAPEDSAATVAADSAAGDDAPPPLASESDSSGSDSDSDASDGGDSEAGSMPSLQTVSDSSDEGPDSDADVYDSDADSDGSGWDEHDVRDDLRRGMETIGGPAESTVHYEPYSDEEEEEWEDEDDEFLEDDFAEQGTEVYRPPGVVDVPRRLSVDNDPQRAETLLAGLETVSDELVLRYEKLRGGDGEAAEGCAICRDDYLIEYPQDPADLGKLSGATLTYALFELLPFHPSPHQILVFPCPGRHLFHRSCLAPWLARKTTCPSCRFDIDPDSLTLRLTGTMSHYASGVRTWEPPNVLGLEDWLAEEETYQTVGHRTECSHAAKPDASGQGRTGPRVTFAPTARDFRDFRDLRMTPTRSRFLRLTLPARRRHRGRRTIPSELMLDPPSQQVVDDHLPRPAGRFPSAYPAVVHTARGTCTTRW